MSTVDVSHILLTLRSFNRTLLQGGSGWLAPFKGLSASRVVEDILDFFGRLYFAVQWPISRTMYAGWVNHQRSRGRSCIPHLLAVNWNSVEEAELISMLEANLHSKIARGRIEYSPTVNPVLAWLSEELHELKAATTEEDVIDAIFDAWGVAIVALKLAFPNAEDEFTSVDGSKGPPFHIVQLMLNEVRSVEKLGLIRAL